MLTILSEAAGSETVAHRELYSILPSLKSITGSRDLYSKTLSVFKVLFFLIYTKQLVNIFIFISKKPTNMTYQFVRDYTWINTKNLVNDF